MSASQLEEIRALTHSLEVKIGRPVHLLVIDDDENCYELFRRMVPGCAARWARDPDSGLWTMERYHDVFDAVIVDQRLGAGQPDGLSVIWEIRKRWQNIMTVLSSGFEFDQKEKETLNKLGHVMFLAKPVQHDKIKDLIEFIRERRGL